MGKTVEGIGSSDTSREKAPVFRPPAVTHAALSELSPDPGNKGETKQCLRWSVGSNTGKSKERLIRSAAPIRQPISHRSEIVTGSTSSFRLKIVRGDVPGSIVQLCGAIFKPR
jgi:hypothetical protein